MRSVRDARRATVIVALIVLGGGAVVTWTRIADSDSGLAPALVEGGYSPREAEVLAPSDGRGDSEVQVTPVTATVLPPAPPPSQQRPPEWRISSAPTLSLGQADGPVEELFVNVLGAVHLADGRIAVVDAGRAMVSFFDSNGEHVRSVGGEGDGPGDLRFPMLLPAASYDSLVVMGTSRISVVGLDGSVRAAGSYAPPDLPRAVLPDGLVYQRFPYLGVRPAVSGPRPTDPEIGILDANTGAREVLAEYRYTSYYIDVSDRGQASYLMPLHAELSLAPMLDGGLAVVVANEGMLRVLRASDRESSSFALPISPIEVTRADVERAIADRLEQSPRLERVLRDMPFPDRFPFVESLVPDGAGGVWARLHPEHARRLGGNWMALSPSGDALAVINVPENFDLFQVGHDFVMGTSRDEWRVQRVHRYELSRTDR